jgi:hypothetical protein
MSCKCRDATIQSFRIHLPRCLLLRLPDDPNLQPYAPYPTAYYSQDILISHMLHRLPSMPIVHGASLLINRRQPYLARYVRASPIWTLSLRKYSVSPSPLSVVRHNDGNHGSFLEAIEEQGA